MAKISHLKRLVLIGFGFFTLLIWVVTFLHYHALYGFQLEVVVSGSMEPNLKTGSLVIIQSVPPHQYRVGDIVSFHPPIKERISVTHRITKLYQSVSGVPEMATKGDANSNGDPWVTSLGAIEGKEVMALPWIGYGVLFLQTPYGFLGVALLTFLGVVSAEITLIWRILVDQIGQYIWRHITAKKA